MAGGWWLTFKEHTFTFIRNNLNSELLNCLQKIHKLVFYDYTENIYIYIKCYSKSIKFRFVRVWNGNGATRANRAKHIGMYVENKCLISTSTFVYRRRTVWKCISLCVSTNCGCALFLPLCSIIDPSMIRTHFFIPIISLFVSIFSSGCCKFNANYNNKRENSIDIRITYPSISYEHRRLSHIISNIFASEHWLSRLAPKCTHTRCRYK